MQVNPAIFTSAVAVTPNDTTKVRFRALHIGGAGTLTVEPADAPGTTVQFTVTAGTLLPLEVTLVKTTGTAATLIVGLN